MVRFAWPGWWLGLLVGVGSPVAAQANLVPPRIELKENYPNPFFPATTIPFSISQEVCAQGASAGGQPEDLQRAGAGGRDPGAQWPRRPSSSGPSGWTACGCGAVSTTRTGTGSISTGKREATPGVYYYQLTVDGERFTRKMIAQKKVTSQQ